MTPAQIIKRAVIADTKKRPWLSSWQDCIDFAQPMRGSFTGEDSNGAERMDRIYDETAVIANQEFVSIMQDGAMPPGMKFFDFETVMPADDPGVAGQLKEVSDYVYDTMYNAYFDSTGAEVFYDIAIGTGTIGVSPSLDTALSSIKFNSIPLQEYSMDEGPFGQPDGRFRRIKHTLDEIKLIWPQAKPSKDMTDKAQGSSDGSHKFSLIDAVYRDWKEADETWVHSIVDLESKTLVFEETDTGSGSEPLATGRWSKTGGEVWGRGPLINALPAIRSLNLTYELLFEASEMNIGGIWTYESNGVINTDNISIVPGTLIPTEPGTRGLQGVQNPGKFDLSQIILRDQQEKVKRAMYNQDFGPTAQTPRSATEIAERSSNLNKLIGASRHRLQRELIDKVIMRTVYLLKKQGKIDLPQLDGRELRIKPVSPMARFAKRTEVQAFQEFHGQLAMMYGPELAMLITKVPETAHEMAKYNNYPVELLNSVDEIKEGLAQIMGAAQQMNGEEVPAEAMQ